MSSPIPPLPTPTGWPPSPSSSRTPVPGPSPDVNTSPTQDFTITITAVNDEPSLHQGRRCGGARGRWAPQTIPGWATAISQGPANESAQTLAFTVTAATPGLFSVQPAVDATTGELTYHPGGQCLRLTSVDIYLSDSGSGVPPNDNTSPTQSFTIDITPVNDAPSFTKGADEVVLEDAGPQTVAGWLLRSLQGAANESAQTLAFTVTAATPGLFSVQPAVDATTSPTVPPTTTHCGR